MPVRRSARLRGAQAAPEDVPTSAATDHNNNNNNQNQNNNTTAHKALDTVMEHEESPVARTPAKPHTTPTPRSAARTPKATPKATPLQKKSPTKTPTSAVTRPTHQEMHPSKVHQSTTKQVDSGLLLGFNPVKKDSQGNIVKENMVHDTPTKAKASPASAYYGTPGFEFKFACQESQLSEEAKKLMESVRKDVAKIKAKLVNDKETGTSGETSQTIDRKIAKPKGKTGRFSDAHMAQFKKMDSIAGHASAFRAVPGRFEPTQKTLKRTNSKARLDEPESRNSPSKQPTQPSSASAIPSAKRVKHDKADDTPAKALNTRKPISSRPRSAVRSSLMTPTRSSVARASAVSLKPARISMIPSLARSPSAQSMTAPRTPRTDFNPRLKSNIPTLGNLKSILRRHQPLFSKDAAKIAAGTHLPAPGFSSDLLLKSGRSASEEPAPTPSPKKRVEFTPITKSREPEVVISPSPSKMPKTPSFSFTSDVVYPTLPALTPEPVDPSKPSVDDATTPTTIRHVHPSEVSVEVSLPEIPGVPHGISHKKRQRAVEASLAEIPGVPHGISHKKRHRAVEDENDAENVPPAGAISGERSAKRLKPSSPSPVKVVVSSPLKSRSHTPMRSISGSNRTGTPASVRAKNRSLLSLSRLNMLAQPKRRA